MVPPQRAAASTPARGGRCGRRTPRSVGGRRRTTVRSGAATRRRRDGRARCWWRAAGGSPYPTGGEPQQTHRSTTRFGRRWSASSPELKNASPTETTWCTTCGPLRSGRRASVRLALIPRQVRSGRPIDHMPCGSRRTKIPGVGLGGLGCHLAEPLSEGLREQGRQVIGQAPRGSTPGHFVQPSTGAAARLPFKVLNCDSLNGLSLLTRGRLWVLVTPRSASSSATGLEAMLLPRSAWMVSCPAGTFSAAIVAASSCSANVSTRPSALPRRDRPGRHDRRPGRRDQGPHRVRAARGRAARSPGRVRDRATDAVDGVSRRAGTAPASPASSPRLKTPGRSAPSSSTPTTITTDTLVSVCSPPRSSTRARPCTPSERSS